MVDAEKPMIQLNSKKLYHHSVLRGWSINKLANELDLSRGYVQDIMQGSKSPGCKFVSAVLRELPYTFDEIFFLGHKPILPEKWEQHRK